MSRSWAGGSTGRWRKIRARVLAENLRTNHGRCTLQIRGVCTGQADQVHHVKGKENGDSLQWLVASCRACNLHLGQPGKRNPEPRRVSSW